MNSGNADRCEWLRVAVNGNATGSLSFVLLEQQQQCKIDNNRRRRRQRGGCGGSEGGGGGDVAVGSQSHKLYFLLPAQRSLLSEGAGEGMRFETSHTLLSAAHATASHSPPLAPFPSLTCLRPLSGRMFHAFCRQFRLHYARGRNTKREREGKGVRCEAGFEVLSGCAADVAAAVVCSCVFCVIA